MEKAGFPIRLTGEEGPDHDKSFCVEVRIGDTVYGSGKGRTKKAAEQQAAYKAILQLRTAEVKVLYVFKEH